MMVDLTVLIIPVLEQLLFKQKNKNLPQGVHICMDQNLDERKKKIKDQPNVDHLDVRSLWQVVRDVDEHCGQHKHCYKREFHPFLKYVANLPVRLTVTTASKKNGLKKFVAWPITFSRTVGR